MGSELTTSCNSRLFVPPVFLDHVGELYDEFAFLVLLTAFESPLILPSQRSLAAVTVDVRHCVKACKQNPLLRRSAPYVHHTVEQVGTTLATLEGFGDEFVMVGEVGAAVDAGVGPVAGGKVRPESLHSFVGGEGGEGRLVPALQ